MSAARRRERVVGYQGLLFGGRVAVLEKRGRPSAGESARSCVLTCRLTPQEFEAVFLASKRAGKPVSSFARNSLISAIRHYQ